MEKILRALIIDDSEYDCELMLHQLKKSGYEVIWQRVDSSERMAEALKLKKWDVILSDHSMPGFNSMDALKIKKEFSLEIPFIIVSGKIGEELAVEAMKNGCQDYVSKDKLKELPRVIERELEEARIKMEHKLMQEELNEERERLDITLRSIGDGVITANINGEIVFLNEKAEELTGWNMEEAKKIGLNEIFKVTDENGSEITSEIINDAIYNNRKRGLKNNSQLIARDGSKLFISANISPMLKNKREITGVVVVFRDISRLKNMEIELSNEQLNLNTIFNAAPIGMIIIDENAKIVKANYAVYRMLNTHDVEVLNRPMGSALRCVNDLKNQRGCGYSDECRNCALRKTLFEVFKSEIPESGIETLHHLLINGKLQKIWFNISSVPIMMDGKRHTVIVLDDITERKQYEEAIKKSRDFYLTLFENFPGLIWRTNRNKEADYFNANWFKFTGTNLGYDKGFGWLERVHNRDRVKCLMTFVETFDRRLPFEMEYRIRRSDGEYRWVLNTGRPFYDLNGKFSGYINIANDITERKIAEDGLKRYQILSEMANDLIIFMDTEGKIIDVNSATLKEFGYSREEMLKKTVFELRNEEKTESAIKEIIETAEKGTIFETVNYRKDGSAFQLEVSTTGTTIQNKKIILGVARNITERKLGEIELEKAKESAEAANRAKSEFLANMSHEIRTPLNGILGMTDLTLMTDLTEEQRDNLNIVKASGTSLLNVINDILDFSKIEAGKMDIEELSFNIHELIERISRTHQKKASKKGIALIYNLNENVPELVIGDPGRLEQILNNLVSNAVKFTDRGEITINVEKIGSSEDNIELKFRVLDTGIGIADCDMDKLFKNFSQVDSSVTRKYGGTGLGLAISKRLVEMMKGRIWVESRKGRGSTFYFTIVLKSIEDKALKSGLIQNEKSDLRLPADKGINILVAEDDRVNQMVVTSMLKTKGYNFQMVNNGIEVLNMLDKNNYDMILMDIRMPRMDGIEATRRIREIEKLTKAHIPIIALTAHAIQGDREKFLSAGMDYYLSKPVQIDELYTTINGAMELKEKGYDGEKPEQNVKCHTADTLLSDEDNGAIQKIGLCIKNLGAIIDRGNFSHIENAAHEIKELSGGISANEIKAIAFKIELNARKEESENLRELYEILVKRFEEISL